MTNELGDLIAWARKYEREHIYVKELTEEEIIELNKAGCEIIPVVIVIESPNEDEDRKPGLKILFKDSDIGFPVLSSGTTGYVAIAEVKKDDEV